MNVAGTLGYEDSPNFLRAEQDFPHAQELGYVLRKAKAECGLQGVYILKPEDDKALPIPVVYFCQTDTEAQAQQIHKRVWNQGIVPFVLVQTSRNLHLYPGFRYSRHNPSDTETNCILRVAIASHEVLDQFAAFQASAIDDGTLWRERGNQVTPDTRVDWTLLEHLRALNGYLKEHGVEKEIAHALIGKFVYFRYLRDRKILSDQVLTEWGIEPTSIFTRHTTLESFLSIEKHTHAWLNGSIFPCDPNALSAITSSLFQWVAGIFAGDTMEGQLHLDFQPYDFSFIPIETLSVVYEQFLHLPHVDQPTSQGQKLGAYYTPLPLIAFIQETLERRRPLTQGMKILDPSCGSGSFLVQCYRRLIERQRQREARPLHPNELREILTQQLFGVERDRDACGVAELSLTLTLLDYITPPDLKNNPDFQLPSLRNTNIFEADFFDPDSVWAKGTAPKEFDWIIGNPPWYELKSQAIPEEYHHVWQWMQAHAHDAPTGGHQVAEAFVWQTLPYLKRDGLAGLVIPAMTFFKKESTSFRKSFFARVRTWCVANFSNLAYVLFAGRAERPAVVVFFQPRNDSAAPDPEESILTYAPLVVNQEANRPDKPSTQKLTWNITINASEIQEVPIYRVTTGEMLPWKLAMWGCFRDARLLEKVARKFDTFSDFCEIHGLEAHEGFQLREKSARSRERLEAKPELKERKRIDFTKLRGCGRIFAFPEYAIDTIPSKLTYVRKGRGEIPMRVSTPPHILVDAGRRFAVYSDEFIAVPARQIGIASAEGKETLLKALSLYLSSDFATYQQFFTTPEWGISTSRATLNSLKNLPVPLDLLSQPELREWAALRDTLAEMSQAISAPLGAGIAIHVEQVFATKMAELNDRVFRVLGLRESERILVHDFITMNVQCIKGKVTKEVLAPSLESTMQSYLQRLKQELDAFIVGQSDRQHKIIVVHDSRSAILAIRLTHANISPTLLIQTADQQTSEEFKGIRERVKQRHSQWTYFNRSLRIYDQDTLYCFKPMQTLHWTERQAILDAGEVIADTLASPE